MLNIAVLITCFNRKEKTLACLRSLEHCIKPEKFNFEYFLVDDGSKDGTSNSVKSEFPHVHVIEGSGNLFWAGGMRLAWNTAIDYGHFNAYLLINDDVVVYNDCLIKIQNAIQFVFSKEIKHGIVVGATKDPISKIVSYGGSRIVGLPIRIEYESVFSEKEAIKCDFANANVMWVDEAVVQKIGVLDICFTHGIADYDYALRATKAGFPVYVAAGACGDCGDDHGENWVPQSSSVMKRIRYLYSPKGLAYNEYMCYVKRHFPMSLPYSFFILWLKTLFPILWKMFK